MRNSEDISNLFWCKKFRLPEARLSRSMRRGGQLTFPGLTNLHVTRTCWKLITSHDNISFHSKREPDSRHLCENHATFFECA